MKIRDKLLLGFGLNFALMAVLGLLAYKEFRAIGTRLTLVEVADDLTNTILEVRRYEKNFLLYHDRDNLDELKKFLLLLTGNIGHIESEIISEIGEQNHGMMKKAIADYESLIGVIADNFTAQRELTEIVRQKGRLAEGALSGPEHAVFLAARRAEKNVMLEKDAGSLEAFRAALGSSGLSRRSLVAEYARTVEKLAALYRQEQGAVEAMRRTARDIQSFTQNLSKQERADIATTLKMSVIVLFVALAIIIVVGMTVNVRIARSIVTPILDLERITKKITRGDFSETIAVTGRDEIASLAESFNQMEDKLDHAMASLEEIIKKLQEKQSQLVEAEKLAAIGKLAAGIAHEINNPLTSVLTFSNLMLEQCDPADPRCAKLKLMARETDRARNIVRQLLNFGREIIIKPERININRPVLEITESLQGQEAFKGIELTVHLADDLPDTDADPAQIGQVVLNLLLNAIHAVKPPGRISVTTRRGERVVEIEIVDSGTGIPEEHLHRIFDPFFTTKDASKGTGLGLAVSYGIVKKHGGEIAVESSPGRGTTFTVKLPVYG
jgi:signal transduction histidine kinase